jgi:hypothetical protein
VLRHAGAAFESAGGIAGRLGGDEFALLLPGGGGDPRFVAGKIAGLLQQVTVGERRVDVPLSIGVATSPEDGSDARSVFDAADARMYAIKHARKRGEATRMPLVSAGRAPEYARALAVHLRHDPAEVLALEGERDASAPPLSGRAREAAGIIDVARAFAALTEGTRRMPLTQAVGEMQRERGATYNPHVVDALIALWRTGRLFRIHREGAGAPPDANGATAA